MKKLKRISPGIAIVAIIVLTVFLVNTISLGAAKVISERGYLGVSIEKLTHQEKKDLDIGHGVKVTQVAANEAGEKAGIQEGDIILFFKGQKILRPDDLVDSVRENAPGSKVDLKIFRDGKQKKLNAVLGELKIRKWSGGDFMNSPHSRGGYLGVLLKELKGDLAVYFGVNAGEGVLILDVSDESPALKAGLKAGDVIVKLDGVDVAEPGDVQEIVRALQAGDNVDVDIIRHKKKKKVKAELGKSRVFFQNSPRFNKFFRIPSGGDRALFFNRFLKEKQKPTKELKRKRKSKIRESVDNINI